VSELSHYPVESHDTLILNSTSGDLPPPPSEPVPPTPPPVDGVWLRDGTSLELCPKKVPEKKWLIGVLYYGAVDREHDRAIRRLKEHPYIHDVLEMTGCPYIDQGRSLMATGVLDDPELGGLLFFDHDMIFDVAEATRLIEAAEATQATTGAAYSMRRPGKIIGGVDVGQLPEGFQVVFFEGGAVLPASYLGMGMTAIPRSVLVRLVAESEKHYARQVEVIQRLREIIQYTTKKAIEWSPDVFSAPMLEGFDALSLLDELVRDHLLFKRLPRVSTGIADGPCVPFFAHLIRPDAAAAPHEGFYYGEDVSFCIRNHEAQIPVRLDTRCRVYHKGAYCYGLEDVGMEVPYCNRLEVLQVADPQAHPALPNATVAQALSERDTGVTFEPRELGQQVAAQLSWDEIEEDDGGGDEPITERNAVEAPITRRTGFPSSPPAPQPEHS
jgi:hypothetical protein